MNITKISLSEIRKSNLNFYGVEKSNELNIQALMNSIKLYGLLEPITVVKNPDEVSNTSYEIVSGHSRFEAVSRLYEDGVGDGTIDCIVEDIMDISDETMLKKIVESNVQRHKTKQQLMLEIKIRDKEWESMENHSGKRDDWMAPRLGVSPRTIRNLRKLIRIEDGTEEEERILTPDDLRKSLKRLSKSIQKNLDLATDLNCNHDGDLMSRLRGCLVLVDMVMDDWNQFYDGDD
jgi:ParB/RepB/Spo0J family partition protein